MSKNVWDLPLDLNFRFSEQIPRFRRKDSAVLNIHLFESKERKDISNFSKATLSIQLPSQEIKKVEATRKGTGIDTYVQYQFTNEVMTEIGLYTLILTVEKDGGRVSTQKFTVFFYDNESKADFEFINMMQKLQLQINYLDSIMDNIVLKDLIGKSNGLIPLDSNGKIPMEYMPVFLEDHINTNIYLNLVHGLMVDANLNLIYKGKGGNLEYVGHKEGKSTLSLMTNVKDSIVTLTYYGVGTVAEQRWMQGDRSLEEMKVKGTVFTGLEFKVNLLGTHTIYYRDSAGVEKLHKFNVSLSQMAPPNYEVYVKDGFLKVEGTPDIAFVKIAEGFKDLAYMRKVTNGTLVVFPYKITKAIWYTVYIVDQYNREVGKMLDVKDSDLEQLEDNRPLKIQLYTNGWFPDKDRATGVVQVSFAVTDADGNNAKDKLDYIITPDSKAWTTTSNIGSPTSLYKNGTYTWKAYNKNGVESTATLKIENIGVEKNLKDLSVGSKFFVFQSEGVVLKKEADRTLIALDFGWNFPFSSIYNQNQSPQKNLLPNSTIKDAVYNVNLQDLERQEGNLIEGDFNYQYATLSNTYPYAPTPVGSPVYYKAKRSPLDIFTIIDSVQKGYFTATRKEMSCTPLNGTNDKIIAFDSEYQTFSSYNVNDADFSMSVVGMWFNNQAKVWQKGW